MATNTPQFTIELISAQVAVTLKSRDLPDGMIVDEYKE